MNRNQFRRDEIAFVEKNKKGDKENEKFFNFHLYRIK